MEGEEEEESGGSGLFTIVCFRSLRSSVTTPTSSGRLQPPILARPAS